jgi:tetratricopeptide (TPR) repeat protein
VLRLTRALGAVSDRTLNRILLGLVAALVIGLPAIGVIYFLDRNVDPGLPIAERAVAAGEEAVRTEPNKLSNRIGLAAAYVAADRLPDAIAQFTEVLRVQATNRAALLGRADAYLALGDLDAAARDYEALVDAAGGEEMANVDPKLEAAYYGLGSIALKQDRPRDAATMLASALKINRTDADALNLMGTALLAISDPTNAVDALRDAIALVPIGWCEPYVQLAQAYTALANTAGATYANGMVATCEKRPADAEALLKPLVGGPFGRDALIGLGLTAEAMGDNDTAIAYYSRVYAADPSDFDAVTGLNRLGTSPVAASSGADATPQASAAPGAGATAPALAEPSAGSSVGN